MKLFKTSISILITSLLLCGNAFSKPDDKPPIEVDVNVVNTPGVVVVERPFIVSSTMEMFDAELFNVSELFTVPTGMTLIIEFMNIYNTSGRIAEEISFRISYADGSEFPTASIILEPRMDRVQNGGNAKIYLPVPQDTTVNGIIHRGSSEQRATYRVTVAGRLIPAED